jgi:hypothetical protein
MLTFSIRLICFMLTVLKACLEAYALDKRWTASVSQSTFEACAGLVASFLIVACTVKGQHTR